MNKKIYIFLVIAFCLSSFVIISGCGKYATQYSAPVILARYPAAGAGGIGTTETLWIKFSKSMDPAGISSIDALSTKIKFASDSTATVTTEPGITPEVIWSEDNSRLSLVNLYFTANSGDKIHFQSSREAFQDVNGLYLPENSELWNFTLSGLNIVDRSPTIDATISNIQTTIVATFDNPVVTGSFLAITGEGHTAGKPIPLLPSFTWSNSDRTLSIPNVSWEAASGTVNITYEAVDIYGNVVTDGQLFKYDVH
jgi:hypothetical protein